MYYQIIRKRVIRQINTECRLYIRLASTHERTQYKNRLMNINKNLKKIAELIGLSVPLTMYVARHSWAGIVRSRNIPVSVVSEGMGHESEATTRIRLASLDNAVIDRAHLLVLKGL